MTKIQVKTVKRSSGQGLIIKSFDGYVGGELATVNIKLEDLNELIQNLQKIQEEWVKEEEETKKFFENLYKK